MAFSRNTQYIVSGLLAAYIVFFTRPAPGYVVGLLASPIAQLVALGLVVYVGATQSLLVAVIASIALVLSIPAREYMTDKKKSPIDSVKEEPKPEKAPEEPKKKPLPDGSIVPEASPVRPAGQTMATSAGSDQPGAAKEGFVGAPF